MRRHRKLSAQDRSYLGIEKMRKNKIGFFNSTWQSEQGQKKKKVKKSQQQLQVCQAVGLNNQQIELQQILQKKTIWRYKLKDTIYYEKIVFPQKSLKDIINILQQTTYLYNPLFTGFFDNSSFSKVIKGKRRSVSGWSLWFIYL